MVCDRMIENPETLATAIRIGKPVSYKKARNAVKNTGGGFSSVSDLEILEAQKKLAEMDGIFAEPASCTTIAGLIKLHKEGNIPRGIKVTCVLTGNGLKDPEAPIPVLPDPLEIEGNWASLQEVFSQ